MPHKKTIEWIDKSQAPDIVIEDLANCIATAEIIQRTNKVEDPIDTTVGSVTESIVGFTYGVVSFVGTIF